MEIAAVVSVAQGFVTDQFPAFVFNRRIVDRAEMRHQEEKILLLRDLAESALVISDEVFRYGKIIGEIVDPVTRVLSFF